MERSGTTPWEVKPLRYSNDPLMFYRARYYQPGIGRFVSEDPIGFGGGINFYAYVKGNPMMYVDPYGLACTWRKMLVTAYCDKGPGSDWDYYRRKKGGVGPGTGASANTAPPGRPAIPQYPYGCPFTVYSDRDQYQMSTGYHDSCIPGGRWPLSRSWRGVS